MSPFSASSSTAGRFASLVSSAVAVDCALPRIAAGGDGTGFPLAGDAAGLFRLTGVASRSARRRRNSSSALFVRSKYLRRNRPVALSARSARSALGALSAAG